MHKIDNLLKLKIFIKIFIFEKKDKNNPCIKK